MTLPDIAPPLLAWYAQNKRVLPFRTLSTPYRVWVSEIMLQQTRVSTALPYFGRFMEALPTIADLAACEPEKLHKLWEGLGYYSRVRNLQKAAQIVMERYGGRLPTDCAALQKLPGIGAYTAGAIASICFGQPVPAVDGNVLRVFARLLDDARDIVKPEVKKELSSAAHALQPPECPGDYNQALMELGALICLPNGAPLCGECPLRTLCAAHANGTEASLPHKAPPPEKKFARYTVVVVLDGAGHVLLCQRPPNGLLAGLWQPVLLEGALSGEQVLSALRALGITGNNFQPLPDAKHIFTHLVWRMSGFAVRTEPAPAPPGFLWAARDELNARYTLPNAYKVYRDAMKKLL